MGLDLKAGGRLRKQGRAREASPNLYLRLAVKLYKFLARRTDAEFAKKVHHRLIMSKTNRPPLSLSKVRDPHPVIPLLPPPPPPPGRRRPPPTPPRRAPAWEVWGGAPAPPRPRPPLPTPPPRARAAAPLSWARAAPPLPRGAAAAAADPPGHRAEGVCWRGRARSGKRARRGAGEGGGLVMGEERAAESGRLSAPRLRSPLFRLRLHP